MIPVIWWNQARGNWDHGLLMSVFDKHPEVFEQINTKEPLPELERAIVIVVGQPVIEPLKNYLKTLKSGIIIFTGDEECAFDCESIRDDSKFEFWTQCYTPHRSFIKERLFLGTPNRIVNYKINSDLPKKYLWSFIGQNHNPFRNKCVDVLKKLPDGFLHVARAFGGQINGIEFQEYLDICCQSRFVICPAGSFTADTFRVYEAIECGAIPIVDKRSPRDSKDFDYWREVYPQNTLIQVNEWTQERIQELLTLSSLEGPSELQKLLTGSEISDAEYQNHWWIKYKKEIEQKLLNFAK